MYMNSNEKPTSLRLDRENTPDARILNCSIRVNINRCEIQRGRGFVSHFLFVDSTIFLTQCKTKRNAATEFYED
jgi:hypothetical protein